MLNHCIVVDVNVGYVYHPKLIGKNICLHMYHVFNGTRLICDYISFFFIEYRYWSMYVQIRILGQVYIEVLVVMCIIIMRVYSQFIYYYSDSD